MVWISLPHYGHGGRWIALCGHTSATYQRWRFYCRCHFCYCVFVLIANKTSQNENTMVTRLHYLIIKLVHHKLYDWGLICLFWSFPGSSSDVLITPNYCCFKRSIKCWIALDMDPIWLANTLVAKDTIGKGVSRDTNKGGGLRFQYCFFKKSKTWNVLPVHDGMERDDGDDQQKMM